ncbi:hypothetical protein N1851_026010 [Merluccius polli]|uniref:Uncharacterized protein n=1 Tax=Merluccius polli TaxID=89951 RepID=A0AA47MCS3_MERPO|nr:hypothetical protein N1851_026010 [Merluccius polli]
MNGATKNDEKDTQSGNASRRRRRKNMTPYVSFISENNEERTRDRERRTEKEERERRREKEERRREKEARGGRDEERERRHRERRQKQASNFRLKRSSSFKTA